MIAAILARLGIGRWVAIAVLCALSAGAALAYRSHLINTGIAIEASRRDAIDKQRDMQAKAELAALNTKLAAAQAELGHTLEHLNQLKSDLDNEKATSAALQSDLAAGRRRMSVAIAGTCRPAQTEQAAGATAAGLDQGGEPATATLDGRAASDLEWARSSRNEVIVALQACTAAYDAVKTAADTK
jgi:septal ring factor EnvC (AmiA/AmiB activator)